MLGTMTKSLANMYNWKKEISKLEPSLADLHQAIQTELEKTTLTKLGPIHFHTKLVSQNIGTRSLTFLNPIVFIEEEASGL